MQARSLPVWVRIALLVAIYFATAELGLSLEPVSGFATPVWPPTGIALVALCLGGFQLWPGITLGAFAVNLLASVPLAETVALPARCFTALGMAVGNTINLREPDVLAGQIGLALGALEALRALNERVQDLGASG
jgi:integral membrane sensor domain MASE1